MPPKSMLAAHHESIGDRWPDWVIEVRGFEVALTTKFRGISRRQGLLVRGPAGWGEFSPFLDYHGDELIGWWQACTEAARDGFPTPRRRWVEVNATVPVMPAEQAARWVSEQGCQTAKAKVADPGSSLDDDLARLQAVRAALGPLGRLRIDANGAWTIEQALAALTTFAPLGLEYVEQPCATVEELAELRARLAEVGVAVPIAADESIRRSGDPERVAELGAADLAVLKVQPLGGVARCLELAQRLGLPVVVSSALETSVGLAAGVALAAAVPTLHHACGLNTAHLLASDVTDHPLVASLHQPGRIPVRPVSVNPDRLRRHALAPDDLAWWLARLADTIEREQRTSGGDESDG